MYLTCIMSSPFSTLRLNQDFPYTGNLNPTIMDYRELSVSLCSGVESFKPSMTSCCEITISLKLEIPFGPKCQRKGGLP